MAKRHKKKTHWKKKKKPQITTTESKNMKIKPKQKNRNLATSKAPPLNQNIHMNRPKPTINPTNDHWSDQPTNYSCNLKPTWKDQTTSHHHCHRSVHQATTTHTNVKPIQRSTPTDHRTNHHFTTIDPRESFRDFSKSMIWERDFRALERWKREGDFGLRKRSLETFVWESKPKYTISFFSTQQTHRPVVVVVVCNHFSSSSLESSFSLSHHLFSNSSLHGQP